MGEVLKNTGALFAILLLGYLLKRLDILSKDDGSRLSIIILNVTLPAAVINNLATLQIDPKLLILAVLGILFNLLLIIIGYFSATKKTLPQQKFLMYSVSGYNIGNFTIPFTQAFLPAALPLLALFDLGNSVMLAGGTTLAIDALTKDGESNNFIGVVKKLFGSPTFLTYLIMFGLRYFEITIPSAVLSVTTIAGGANTFLSMFMIGLFLDLYLPKDFHQGVVKVLGVRYLTGIVMGLIIVLLPLPQMLTIVLCLLCVGPMSTFGVINSVKAGMAEEAVGFASSASFLISFLLMTGVLMVFL
ncbi:putative permease [Enterococcus sp. PF1-24]|uniref:AEC family transporter n=1 Tax=unclassified Enterococcus TaxID=2608891 RepID=UPI002473788F|nr:MULTISPECIES: AEC family transporter [unclassified Enterococcus]MDH6363655.1 putative permease [Enterococcus sp. PFB1-1]MDH6400890.1 putative permease [Enterococcus sp. PF1-24]